MKKIIVSLFIIGIVVFIYLLIKIMFFNKNIPTGDQNGEILTTYSSNDMLGNWNISIIKKQSEDLSVKSNGTMHISSIAGKYFYGTITINESEINDNKVLGGTVDVEGTVYNDHVTIYFNYDEEYLNINYEAEFTPEINNNYLVLNLNINKKETYKYIFNLVKTEVYENEK